MRSKAWAALLLLSITRCSCEEGLTRVVDPPDSGRPMDPGVPLDAGQPADPDAGEPDSGEMVVEPDAGEPDSGEVDSGATTDQLCGSLGHEALSRSFTFSDVGPCPWGQGDNLPLEGAVGRSARTEQIETFTLPENAVICAASFEVPQTDMWFDDAMVIAFSQVVLMTDANVGLFPSD